MSEEINGLVLHHISKYAEKDRNFSFISEPTESGIDNFVTHHIYSILNLFINIRLATKDGGTGAVGIYRSPPKT